jgi:hypothetical protein
MKAFISRVEDEIRLPYAKRAIIRPRVTVFCGSVNDAEFLTDMSGSRRFWPVQVDGIDWGFEMDWTQLWAQSYAFWLESSSFDLTAEEDAHRERTAVLLHSSLSSEAEMIGAYHIAHAGDDRFPEKAMNRTEILGMLYGKQRMFSAKQTSDAGKILTDLVGKHRLINGKQRAWMFPFNEFAADSSSWPTPRVIKSVPD